MTKLRHGHALANNWSPTYNTWKCMKARCQRPTHDRYPEWGGRGIKVCERWQIFENFLEDMGPRPVDKTLERIDNEGHYEKENCRWADGTEQKLNQKLRSDNTSGKKGVSWCTTYKKWKSGGQAYGKKYKLYYGDSFEEACEAREAWEIWLNENLETLQ